MIVVGKILLADAALTALLIWLISALIRHERP